MGILGLVADRGLLFKPGSRYEYSNSNYMLLGLVAEKHYAKPLANIIADEIGVPLGLASLKLCDDEYGANGQAKPYVRDGEKIIDAPYRSMSHSFGAGGICSDVSDVWKWNRALHLGKVVSAESYKMMITPEGAAKAGAEPYGFGLIPRAVAGRPALTHGGTIPGFINVNVWIPSDEISVTIALNTSSTPETPALLRDLARIALGQPVRIAEPSAGPPPDAKTLRAYEGTYTIQVPGRPLDIRFWVDGGVLMSQAEGQNEAPMRLVGEHAFGTKRDWTVEFAFVLENGRATGFTFHQAGLTFQGVRKR
jgi:CubicO group peptidase (beta-lactamase class C family)